MDKISAFRAREVKLIPVHPPAARLIIHVRTDRIARIKKNVT